MRNLKLAIALCASLIVAACPAIAQTPNITGNTFQTGQAGKTAQGVVFMCINAQGKAVPSDAAGTNCPGGGGGGGGAVTIANGADAALGSTTDAPASVPASTTAATLEALMKALLNVAAAPPAIGAASGGISVKTLAALTNTAIAVKASAGQVFSGQCSNSDTTHWAYLQIFNVAAASVTMGTTPPADFVGIPPGANAGFALSLVGEQYSTAISAGAASTSTGGTAPTTALDCTVKFN